jgi:retron-type reverse transcriptase
MKKYLVQVADLGIPKNPGSLYYAWNQLYSKASPKQRENSAGLDNETIASIKLHESKVLKQISDQILSSSGYSFSFLKPVIIPKGNGKNRIICVPTIRDRVVQKSIQIVITKANLKYTRFNKVNFGFVKNYGVKDAINRAIALRNYAPYVYKTDISAFFDNIDRSVLKDLIRKKIRFPSLCPLIEGAIDMEISTEDHNTYKKITKAGIQKGKGVRQGMPLSPFFANLYLTDFDILIQKKGYKAVRYADDLVFFAQNENECIQLDSFVRNELGKIGLTVPEIAENTKTKVYTPEQIVDFLGIGIMKDKDYYTSVVTEEQREEIKRNIMRFADINYLNSKEINLPKLYCVIKATLQGYIGVYQDCFDASDFSNRLYQWARSALRDLMLENYKIDIYTLSETQRKFLIGI